MVEFDSEVTGEEVAEQLIALRRQIDELEVKFSRLAIEFDKTSWWAFEGFNTAFDWIRINCHLNSHQAWTTMAAGSQKAGLTQPVQAWQPGGIGFALGATMPR